MAALFGKIKTNSKKAQLTTFGNICKNSEKVKFYEIKRQTQS